MAIKFLNTVQVDTDVLYVDTENDRVGIGTDSPSAGLDVVDVNLGAMFRLSNTEANATIKYGAILGRHYTNSEENITGMLITSSSSGTGGSVSIGGGISAANAVNNVIFFTAANNTTLSGSERMRINSSGNVGIGATSPTAKLEVNGTININNGGDRVFIADPGQGTFSLGDLDAISSEAQIIGDGVDLLFKNDDTTTMVATSNNRVGIGTISPEAKLSVVGETSTNNLIGGSINLATSYGWTIPSGTFTQRVGYYGGDFTLNGLAAENSMELGLGPFNDRQLLWTTIGSIDSDGDGGWNKTLTNLDINSSYLSVVYFRRTSSETAGTFYHGTGNNILNLNGTANTNPYFTVRALSGFDQNVWYASVGVIQSNSDSNTVAAPIAGIYRLDTGAKILDATTYKFDTSGATLSRGHRAYLFYSADVDVVGQFANPGFYKIDGDQPKLHDIIGSDNDDAFWSADGDDIYNDNSGNVGIGTTSPGAKLHVDGGVLVENDGDELFSIDISSGSFELGDIDGLNDMATVKGTGSSIQIMNDATATLTSTVDNYIGIGTTSPDVKLDVVSGTNNGIRVSATDTTSNWRDIGIRSYVTQAEAAALTDHTYLFTTNPTGQTDPAFQRFGGTVIQCRDDGNSNFAIRIGNGTGHTTALNLNSSGVATFNNSVTAKDIDTSGGDGYLINGMGFAIESSGLLTLGDWDSNEFETRIMDQNASEVLRVTDGNVGIGVTSPGSKLQVYRSDSTFASTLAHMETRSSLELRSSSADTGTLFVAQGASGSTIIQTASDNATTARNLNLNPFGGNVSVGIGTANPSEKLAVIGNVVATNFVLSSDKRLKENIEKVCDNRVKADWKTFELKTEKGEKRYGVIAQELEENHPEFIKTDNEGFKSVKYIDLLIAKIAELEARLEKAGI